jgi:hypothetical protein
MFFVNLLEPYIEIWDLKNVFKRFLSNFGNSFQKNSLNLWKKNSKFFQQVNILHKKERKKERNK